MYIFSYYLRVFSFMFIQLRVFSCSYSIHKFVRLQSSNSWCYCAAGARKFPSAEHVWKGRTLKTHVSYQKTWEPHGCSSRCREQQHTCKGHRQSYWWAALGKLGAHGIIAKILVNYFTTGYSIVKSSGQLCSWTGDYKMWPLPFLLLYIMVIWPIQNQYISSNILIF